MRKGPETCGRWWLTNGHKPRRMSEAAVPSMANSCRARARTTTAEHSALQQNHGGERRNDAKANKNEEPSRSSKTDEAEHGTQNNEYTKYDELQLKKSKDHDASVTAG